MSNRVWVYLSDKAFTEEVESGIRTDIQLFLNDWNAHGTALSATYQILHKRFIIIQANEEKFMASGCSIDKQLRFIKQTEQKYGLSLLNRLIVAYKSGNEIQVVHSSKIAALLASKEITENTLIYNVGVGSDKELANEFEIPLRKSWLAKFIPAGV